MYKYNISPSIYMSLYVFHNLCDWSDISVFSLWQKHYIKNNLFMNRLLNTSRFILLNTFLQKKYTPVVQTQLYSLSLFLSLPHTHKLQIHVCVVFFFIVLALGIHILPATHNVAIYKYFVRMSLWKRDRSRASFQFNLNWHSSEF